MSAVDYNIYSYIAHTFTGEVLDLQVCKSNAGWYIGVPMVARDSVEYYRSEYAARAALTACSWTQRRNP